MESIVRLPSSKDIKKRIIDAIVALYRYDHELIDKNANERSITHKLAEHLQKEFPYWHVDCEYNRFGSKPKRIHQISNGAPATDPEAIEAVTVFPDIIVHRRGTNQNLLVIEVKKTGEDTEWDRKKLEAFIQDQDYCYKYGLLLILAGNGGPKLLLYCDGQEIEQWTEEMRSALRSFGYAPE
ncbi:MAG TPA: hypothetical protein PK864_04055 [Syntrophorhabdaceae bacterium]|nr:hypothetical protein [Syntrophorhabdaceae bacterium]HOL04685.1 hypothetical protein [Syntrophorhabdaceae bacterium]HON85188.1 hypothetical protein [Syntrophorhabdaceae bacterium]HOT42635.1 hypothetical protein [Syntrophorhabdaceae bacterium]HPC66119.1 hypothetical protein [Syntrophorhabdaceae bacterium]